MFIYWLMFFIPAFVVLIGPLRDRDTPWIIFIISLFYILIVGLRFEVGCDWFNYLRHFRHAEYLTNYTNWQYASKDIGYAFLNIFSANVGGSVVLVNFISATICMTGLSAFARRQPEPLLVYVVAVPYIVIVLFQGYTRQAVAFGFELFALVVLEQSKHIRFVMYVLFAAAFHKTAVVLMPLAALASAKNRLWTYFWAGVTSIFAYIFFLEDQQAALWDTYVVQSMESSGAGIRVAMNVVPSVLFLILHNRFSFKSQSEKKLWFSISILSIACIPVVFISSTAVDRFALYLMPLQLYVFSRLPLVFPKYRKTVILAVVVFFFSVQFVWLNYASHSFCWFPYEMKLF